MADAYAASCVVGADDTAPAAAIRLCECSYLLLCTLLPDAVIVDNAAHVFCTCTIKAAAVSTTRWCECNYLLFLL